MAGWKRMQPRYGGQPLPLDPIVTPCVLGSSLIRKVAADFCKVLEKELVTGEDGTPPKWDGKQREAIRRKLERWRNRAAGQDAHYTRHGTHQRPMQAEPPGPSDDQVERLRRAAKLRGDYVTSSEYRRIHTVPLSRRIRQDIVRRWGAQAKAAGPVPGKVKKKSGHYDEDKGGD